MANEPLGSDRLAVFVAVEKHHGFSSAARELKRTQSAVSQAILHLERELGQRLFVRDGRRTELTDAGRLLLEHAERVLADLALARERLAALSDLRSGALVIGTTDTLACYFLPPVLLAYRARYPGVELRLDTRPSPVTAARVAERRVDVGVVTLPLPATAGGAGRSLAERLHYQALIAHEDVVICPREHPFSRRRRLRVEDLAKEPLLLLDRTTGSRSRLDAAFQRLGERPRVLMETASVEVLKRLTELGFGISVVPRLSVEREIAAKTLIAVELGGMGPRRNVGLVTPVRGSLSRAAAAFVELARAAAPAPGRAKRPGAAKIA